MLIAFIDESGSPDPEEYGPFAVAALLTRETGAIKANHLLSNIRKSFNIDSNVELHTADIVHGKKAFRSIRDFNVRKALIDEMFNALLDINPLGVSVVAHKGRAEGTKRYLRAEIKKTAFRYLIERTVIAFNKIRSEDEMLLAIVDETTYREDRLIMEVVEKEITEGIYLSSWAVSKFAIARPLFISSKDSQMLQLADLVSYTIYKQKSGKPVSSNID
ncbi:MAG: DUF3800 domain-containing protein, partial [Candidatus Bathyarchaeota archaeon]|nr:DUF3800 domain-containing protein [Candidatus Bathyarchaeota archaeon]